MKAMSEIIVIINSMAVMEVIFKRECICQLLLLLESTLYPLMTCRPSCIISNQTTTCGCHFHDVVRLFQFPQFIRDALKSSLNSTNIPNLCPCHVVINE